MKSKVINLKKDKIHYRLTRLDDDAYDKFFPDALPIEDDCWFCHQLYRSMEQLGYPLNFAQVYVALKLLSGESNEALDDWKGSFAFPFKLDIRKENGKFAYLLNIYNIRETLYFGFRKILTPDEKKRYDRWVIHRPIENEFSREEINDFTSCFYGYLLGFFEVVKEGYNEPFFKRVDSNGILFGYKDGQFFEEHYKDEKEYKKAVEVYEKIMPAVQRFD
jgi:hypothetical protein